MAQLVAGNGFAFRIDKIHINDLVDGPYVSQSGTNFTFDTGGGYIDSFTGQGFTYDNRGDPASGTITGIHETLNGATTFDITGLNTAVADFGNWLYYSADRTAFASMFSGNDSFTGSNLSDYIEGYDGHDYLIGGDGSDTLGGGNGNDHIWGQSAGGGPDGNDELYGDAGSDYIQGNAGNDSIDGGTGNDRLIGGQGNDLILGDDGNDSANGNLGDDTIRGEAGDDFLRGGQGNDSISGGDGNDTLSGDLGTDTLRGGDGADLFQFGGLASTIAAGPDTILDYLHGTDHIALGFTPAAILTGAPQTTLSAATAAQALFDGHAGDHEVAALSVGSDTYLFYSSSGGTTVDSAVLLDGVSANAIGASDFA